VRIVSFLPSATEIVFSLGQGSALVGRSEECDFPPEVARIPVVMRARHLDRDASSRAIDARVTSNLQQQESLYEIDLERLRALAPDVVLTQDLCRVCSITEAELVTACASAGVRPTILSLEPRTLDQVWGSIATVGDAIGASEQARQVISDLERRTLLEPSSPPVDHPTVAVVEWVDPPILSGFWTPEMAHRAGATYLGPRVGAPAQRSTWQRIADAEPDLVVVSPCSFRIERTRREMGPVAAEVETLGPRLGVWTADEAYFSRPGPRLAEGVALLRYLIGRGTGAPSLPFERWASKGVVSAS
jgi:iron complex transport system substrate-binding protein